MSKILNQKFLAVLILIFGVGFAYYSYNLNNNSIFIKYAFSQDASQCVSGQTCNNCNTQCPSKCSVGCLTPFGCSAPPPPTCDGSQLQGTYQTCVAGLCQSVYGNNPNDCSACMSTGGSGGSTSGGTIITPAPDYIQQENCCTRLDLIPTGAQKDPNHICNIDAACWSCPSGTHFVAYPFARCEADSGFGGCIDMSIVNNYLSVNTDPIWGQKPSYKVDTQGCWAGTARLECNEGYYWGSAEFYVKDVYGLIIKDGAVTWGNTGLTWTPGYRCLPDINNTITGCEQNPSICRAIFGPDYTYSCINNICSVAIDSIRGGSITCNSNSDCNDNNPCTTDTCLNPGTTSSYCSNVNNPVICPTSQITCYSNSDCNDNNPCTTDTCLNPGTTSSYCSNVNNPVNGGWSDWGPCIGGTQTRTCNNPSPACGGSQCTGPSSQSCSNSQIWADIKANNNDGPISITYNTNATISWNSNNAVSCSISPGGWAGTFGSQSSPNLTSNTTYNLSCIDSSNDLATDSVQIRILGVSLLASPNNGAAPLNNVSLTASVSGTSNGTFKYFFDCNNDGIDELVTEDIWVNPYTANNLCSYSSPGVYTAKVRVFHNFGQAVTTTTITVNPSASTSTNYILNVYLGGTGSGRVTSSPSGINCPSNCSASFASGTNVQLQATPLAGSQFSGWSGDCSGTNTTCQVTMNSSKLVNATFNLTGGGGGNQHLECSSNNTCVTVSGSGPNRCSIDEDCGYGGAIFKGVCQGNACINQKCNDPNNCVSQCKVDQDCGGSTESHLECYGNACVIKGGSGTNTCTKIGISGPQCRPTIREIMPFLNPPSMNEFLKNTASIFFSWF